MMTTDNRTNEPTEAQVEAAAKAMHARDLAKSKQSYPDRPSFWAKLRPAYYEHARAALVAAQGAAPQAEALPETGNELRDEDGDLISSGKHLSVLHQGGYVCDTCTNVLGINVRWDHAIERDDHAPVLPSGGVDEDKLAEVERAAAARALEEAADALEAHPDERDLGMGYSAFMGDAGEPVWLRARAEAYRQERGEQ